MLNIFKRTKKQPLKSNPKEGLVGVYSNMYCPKCKDELYKNIKDHWCSNPTCNYSIKNEEII